MGKPCKREFVQVLRLLEVFRPDDVHAAVRAALERGVIGFDAVKHLVLCRIEIMGVAWPRDANRPIPARLAAPGTKTGTKPLPREAVWSMGRS
jgi:hypothetical protein